MAKWSATKGKNLAHRIKLKTGTTRKIQSGKVSCECCFGIAKKYNKNMKHLKNRRNRRRSAKKCHATFISHFVLISRPTIRAASHLPDAMQCKGQGGSGGHHNGHKKNPCRNQPCTDKCILSNLVRCSGLKSSPGPRCMERVSKTQMICSPGELKRDGYPLTADRCLCTLLVCWRCA